MADPPPDPDSNGGDVAGTRPDRGTTGAYPGAPRWVKVFGLVLLALVLLVVVVMLVSGGHGPARHLPSGGAGGHPPPVALMAHRPWR
jgi:hypothetical protein